MSIGVDCPGEGRHQFSQQPANFLAEEVSAFPEWFVGVQDTLCDSEILRRLRKLRSCSAAEWVAGAVLKVGLQAVVVAQDCGT